METKYEIIMNYIKSEIQNGNFKSKLPSIRALAIKFSCSNSTVIRAYSELEKNSLIYAMPKSGYFVSNNNAFFSQPMDENVINFSSGEPNHSILPAKDFKDSIDKSLDKYGSHLFSYGDPEGFLPLKVTLSKLFAKEDIEVAPNDIQFTNGAQEALAFLSLLEFPNKKTTILIENPTYNLYIGFLKINDFNVMSLERSFSGIDLNELENIFKNNDIKFFYTIPRLHNPLGTSYSETQKKAIVDLANKYDVYILEDDYLYQLWEKDDKSLKSYDTQGRVIHMKSFSKTLLPGMRLGTLTLPESLKNNFMNRKIHHALRCPHLFQGALNEFIENGQYSSYIVQIKKYYSQKLRLLKQSFENNPIEGMSYYIPNNGFFSFVNLPSSISISELYNTLMLNNVEIRDGKFSYYTSSPTNSIRLSISNPNDEGIIKGTDILLRQIKELANIRHNKMDSMIEL